MVRCVRARSRSRDLLCVRSTQTTRSIIPAVAAETRATRRRKGHDIAFFKSITNNSPVLAITLLKYSYPYILSEVCFQILIERTTFLLQVERSLHSAARQIWGSGERQYRRIPVQAEQGRLESTFSQILYYPILPYLISRGRKPLYSRLSKLQKLIYHTSAYLLSQLWI